MSASVLYKCPDVDAARAKVSAPIAEVSEAGSVRGSAVFWGKFRV